ncbi:hypothetical protein WBJ53_13930 [Spirosoma sp. SC4-14]|uniref:hypothetical protein n=1 Tax=Spirosoma sp. SC4-14 TaxID=3128900 RepID=UPI0030CF4F09
MESGTLNHKAKITASLLTALVVLFLAGGIYYWKKSWSLAKQNDLNELRADSLLSAKLRLEGDLRTLANQLDMAKDESQSLDNRINQLHGQLDRQTNTIGGLRRENSSRDRTIGSLHQDLSTLSVKGDSMQNQLEASRDKISWLTQSNELLISQNKELQQKVSDLTETLATKAPRAAITGDAFLVEATKPNQKQTAKAKKVHRLMVSLNVPAEMQLKGVQDVYLSLTDSQHNAMMSPLRSTTISLSNVNQVIPVHAIQGVDFSRNPQRISFNIAPDHTIRPGHYRAAVFTKDAYLGSVEFQFRDSFLFF